MKYALRKRSDDTLRVGLAEYPELLQHLLFSRGIMDASSAQAFINPQYEAHSHDPFLMKGMEEAVSRIYSLIRENKRIVIFSDYDADGVPGGVVLHDFFKKIGFTNFSNYIPHRHDEGFGLNSEAIEEFAQDGVQLIITVDCGIADEKEIKQAKKLGVETIVTDHHLPPPNGVPSAFAILDPKQKGCKYPFKELCGAGVAFKLVQALLLRASTLTPSPFTLPPVGWEKWLLDLVGIATLSDMVPLVGENRVFARYGLLVLRKSPRPGLQKLLRKSGIDQRRLTEDDIAFSVTPKLNAASRLGSPDVAFRLLATTDETEADTMVDQLAHLNNERKGIVGNLVREIKKIVAERYENPHVIVVGNPLWRPSLLGLAANTLAREHACPVFLWGRDGENCIKGSCRSDGQVSVFALMQAARGAFLEFGGHAFSGGFSVAQDKIHTLEATLSAAREKVEKSGELAETVVDWKLRPDEASTDTHRLLSQLAPFGEGNPKPVFLLDNVLVQQVKSFGKEKNHLELLLTKSNGGSVKAISFFFENARPPQAGAHISLLASLEESSFGGRTELRLRIVEIL